MHAISSSVRFLLFLTVVGGSWSSTSFAEELNVNLLQANIFKVVDKAMPAAVAINNRGSIFSGVIINSEGLILTAGHAVRPKRSYEVMLADGRKFRARGLGTNEKIDMAMIQIIDPKDLPFAEMGHSSAIIPNQPCLSISFPGTYDPDRGAVVRFGYVVKPLTSNEGMMETTAMMEPGDSGGPLFDLNGKVIGIHSNIRRSISQNYDVPIDSFRQYWDELKTPSKFDIVGWPSLPKLGFRGKEKESGVEVVNVYPGGLAESSGLKAEDLIEAVAEKNVATEKDVYDRLVYLRSKGVNSIALSILRNDQPQQVMIDVADKINPVPKSYPQLRELNQQYKALESRLDDNQLMVRSRLGGRNSRIWATRIAHAGRGNVITKSSCVGSDPTVQLPEGERLSAEVVDIDSANDLVLLHVDFPNQGGVDLDRFEKDPNPRPGQLVISPDAKGDGKVSVWGSQYFDVPRARTNGGYLGVQLGDQSGSVVFDEVMLGAARTAGVKSGDVLLKMNDLAVTKRMDVINFLKSHPPKSKVNVVIQRDGDELEKEIVLGTFPNGNQHVADLFSGGKSVRRDGFSRVASHDADIRPTQCGGPVFDTEGVFLGINVSRTSRVRTYLVPRIVIKTFVEQSNSGSQP